MEKALGVGVRQAKPTPYSRLSPQSRPFSTQNHPQKEASKLYRLWKPLVDKTVAGSSVRVA